MSCVLHVVVCFFFFFQAEDGIRDLTVTGVQTCALPISRTPAAVVYARLGEAPLAPDVVIFACRASAAMYLGEAARSVGAASALPPLLRPTCMAIPAAAAHGATMSLGCIGNRVYTGIPDDHVYMMVRGADLGNVADALDGIMNANAQLTTFHQTRDRKSTRLNSSHSQISYAVFCLKKKKQKKHKRTM